MSYENFDQTKRTYHELSDGYALQSAPERAFGINYAIYRHDPDFDEFLDYGADLQGLNYCFWVLCDGQKIGGIILRPNHIEGLFVRPPHGCAYELLQHVMPLLQYWSDRSQPIEAVNVTGDELELYQRLGFRLLHARRTYIRPTEPFAVDWDSQYEVRPPTEADAAAIAALFHVGYQDYPEEHNLGHYPIEKWLERTQKNLLPNRMTDTCRNASTLVHDASGNLVGACLVGVSGSIVSPDVKHANVKDVSVHPDHRRRGLAARMLQHALSRLCGHFPVLKFGVAVGNDAEAFYYSQGFLPGPAEHKLLLQI